MPMHNTTEWATIGKVVALFGIQGELKVRSLTDIPNRFAQIGKVYLGSEHTLYTIAGVRPYKNDVVILKLVGINDANAAESLRDSELCIPLDQLAKLPPDSYYQHDIIGLLVATVSGHTVGKVVDILETGSNDVYVVKAEDGRQFLIPAIKAVIKQIDLIRQMMYIEPMRGMLDDDVVVVDQHAQAEEEVE